ncbi:MAG TPA: creatininase family protein [Gaiellaceae bacterium]|nr:creatininase family protein [Gaiellaceae bacterium]
MRVRDLNWMQLEEYLARDDRIVLPVGSTEQHAYLSLETDNIIAERLAVEAAEPLSVPVLPVLAFGVTGFTMFPGSPSLQPETYGAVVRDILSSLHAQGFRRFFVVNGHSGNKPDAALAWAEATAGAAVIWHEVWDGRPDEVAAAIDADYDHASWSENFPWTRLEGVESPPGRKPPYTRPSVNTDAAWREALGDGSFGGPYQLPDDDVVRVWNVAVEELRARLKSGWA